MPVAVSESALRFRYPAPHLFLYLKDYSTSGRRMKAVLYLFPECGGRFIVGNAVNPGRETAVSMKRGKVGEGFHKTVLCQLFGIFR